VLLTLRGGGAQEQRTFLKRHDVKGGNKTYPLQRTKGGTGEEGYVVEIFTGKRQLRRLMNARGRTSLKVSQRKKRFHQGLVCSLARGESCSDGGRYLQGENGLFWRAVSFRHNCGNEKDRKPGQSFDERVAGRWENAAKQDELRRAVIAKSRGPQLPKARKNLRGEGGGRLRQVRPGSIEQS